MNPINRVNIKKNTFNEYVNKLKHDKIKNNINKFVNQVNFPDIDILKLDEYTINNKPVANIDELHESLKEILFGQLIYDDSIFNWIKMKDMYDNSKTIESEYIYLFNIFRYVYVNYLLAVACNKYDKNAFVTSFGSNDVKSDYDITLHSLNSVCICEECDIICIKNWNINLDILFDTNIYGNTFLTQITEDLYNKYVNTTFEKQILFAPLKLSNKYYLLLTNDNIEYEYCFAWINVLIYSRCVSLNVGKQSCYITNMELSIEKNEIIKNIIKKADKKHKKYIINAVSYIHLSMTMLKEIVNVIKNIKKNVNSFVITDEITYLDYAFKTAHYLFMKCYLEQVNKYLQNFGKYRNLFEKCDIKPYDDVIHAIMENKKIRFLMRLISDYNHTENTQSFNAIYKCMLWANLFSNESYLTRNAFLHVVCELQWNNSEIKNLLYKNPDNYEISMIENFGDIIKELFHDTNIIQSLNNKCPLDMLLNDNNISVLGNASKYISRMYHAHYSYLNSMGGFLNKNETLDKYTLWKDAKIIKDKNHNDVREIVNKITSEFQKMCSISLDNNEKDVKKYLIKIFSQAYISKDIY